MPGVDEVVGDGTVILEGDEGYLAWDDDRFIAMVLAAVDGIERLSVER